MLDLEALDHIPEDSKIHIIYKPRGQEELVEGEATLHAHVAGVKIMVRMRNKGRTEMLDWDEVESIEELQLRPKRLRARMLKVVTFWEVRAHLIERHSVKLSWINRIVEAGAQEMHDNIDHRDLGHTHPDMLRNGKTESLLPDQYMNPVPRTESNKYVRPKLAIADRKIYPDSKKEFDVAITPLDLGSLDW